MAGLFPAFFYGQLTKIKEIEFIELHRDKGQSEIDNLFSICLKLGFYLGVR
jgi:hypothetical protein